MKKIIIAIVFLFTIINSNLLAGWQIIPTGSSAYLTSCNFIDSMTGYIGGINGFLSKTTNGGVNWITQDPVMSSQFVRAISFVNATTGYLCGDDGFIRKTTNGGNNWIPQTTNTSAGIYGIDAVDALTVYASVNNGTILRSTDGGASYSTVNVSANQLLTIDFSSRDTGYAAGQGGVVYKTTNGGLNWTSLNASTLNNFWDICALDNNNLYVAAYYGTLEESNDAGNNFKSAFAPNILFEDIQMVNSMIGYACGLDGVILKTTNGGNTWYTQTSGTTESLNEVFFLNSKVGFIVGTNGTLLKTTDGSDNFSVAVISPNNREVLICGTTTTIQWSSVFPGNARLEYSTNNGTSWNVIQNSVPAESFAYNWLVPFLNSSNCKIRITSLDNPSLTDVSDGTFTIITANPFYNVPDLVYYRFNHGVNTTPNYAVPGEIIGDANITGMTLQNGGLADSSLVGQGGSGLTNFVSTNWATYLPESGWTVGFWVSGISLGVNPNNAVYLFADLTANNLRCYYGGALGLTSQDTAIMFRCNGLSDIRIPVVQGQTYYIHVVYDASILALKVYVNGQLSQTLTQSPVLPIGNGPLTIGAFATFSSSLAQGMRLDEFRIYSRPLDAAEIAATWNVTFPIIITGINENEYVSLPEKFTLYNNYPNPFNPSTKINFDIPQEFSNVRLAVYNSLGEQVEVLLNQSLHRGSYSINFDAKNLSSGVYFYKLTAGNFTSTKRMIVLK